MRHQSFLLIIILMFGWPTVMQSIVSAQSYFPDVIKDRNRRIDGDISIKPKVNKIRFRKVVGKNGKTSVLSIPIEIKNSSKEGITMKLNHEWPGGIWPETSLYVFAKQKTSKHSEWSDSPGYQVGKEDLDDTTVIEPGTMKRVDIRLNWPGTGSVPIFFPLINKTGVYQVKFLLCFQTKSSAQFVETNEFEIHVIK